MERVARSMSRRAVLGLYPSAWRARYGAEVSDLLDGRPLTWSDTLDLARGAVDAHLHPQNPSSAPARAALLAGAAWTVVAIGYLAEPVPPDWPGFRAWTLLPGMVGALAGLLATLGMALRLDGAPGRLRRGSTIAVAVTGAGWVAGLSLAAAGGPYGATTAALGSLVAVSTVALGVVLLGHSEPERGLALVIIGGALLLPPPAAWGTAALAWTVVGLWMTLATPEPTAPQTAS